MAIGRSDDTGRKSLFTVVLNSARWGIFCFSFCFLIWLHCCEFHWNLLSYFSFSFPLILFLQCSLISSEPNCSGCCIAHSFNFLDSQQVGDNQNGPRLCRSRSDWNLRSEWPPGSRNSQVVVEKGGRIPRKSYTKSIWDQPKYTWKKREPHWYWHSIQRPTNNEHRQEPDKQKIRCEI